MSDPDWRVTMDVLTSLLPAARFTDENLLCLCIGRMANLGLRHGHCDGSSLAYVGLGTILGPYFGDYRAAFRFGRLSLELVEKQGLDRFKARVYLGFASFVQPWTRHVRTSRELQQRAYDTAIRVGDLTYAAYGCAVLVTNRLATGEPLGDVQREAQDRLAFARKIGFGLVVDFITSQHRMIRTLRGLTPTLASKFYRAKGYEPFADLYLRKARDCYARWGADGKVRQLEQRYSQLVETRPPASSTCCR